MTANTTVVSVYDALGQRIRKVANGAATVFAYDEAGHLIGEYDATGELIQEIVWMGDIPLATLRLEACGFSIFYIHTDHLNTPRRITRRSTQDVVWSWESDPFGNTAPNENPSGLGTFSFSLRLPGQYYDQETGLNYNMARDYVEGYVNIDVRCKNDCKKWEIHDRISLAAYDHISLGPNLYATAIGLRVGRWWGALGANIAINGAHALATLYAALNSKASPILSALRSEGPTGICIAQEPQ